jgi:hypothetical protein
LEVPVAELHRLLQDHVLLRRELLVEAAAVDHVLKVLILDKLSIRRQAADVLQSDYKAEQMI